MGDKTGTSMYDWTGDTSSSLLFSARLFPRQGVNVFPPKQKGLSALHKAFAQAQLEEAYKKISPG